MAWDAERLAGNSSRRHVMLALMALVAVYFFYSTFAPTRDVAFSEHAEAGTDTATPSGRHMSELLRARPKTDTLIFYVYMETENALLNAKFFINHGLHSAADFIFIMQGEGHGLTTHIPRKSNIRVIERENTCMDLGAYGEVLRKEPGLVNRYKKFIFVNASIRGPFIPTWSNECWSKAYTSKLDTVTKLQSMSAHCLFNKFQVQSMIFATDREGLQAILDNGSFDCVKTHDEAIQNEVKMAERLYNSSGWESNAFTTSLHGDPLYQNRHTCQEVAETRDPHFDRGYFGFTMSPYETMFVKANRNVDPHMVEKMTEWHDRMGYSSYDKC